jgi:RNA polymerase sigma-70 factor (ECF subfamily)
MYAALTRLFIPGAEAAEAEAPRAALQIDEDEQRLVRACQGGDRAALHLFYQRYVGRVRTLVTRIVGPGETDELTQEVFVKALRGIHGFRGESQLGTWIYRLAVNAALSYATREQGRQRRQLGDDMLQLLPAESQQHSDPFLRSRLEAALSALPAGYRAVLVLHDIEGLQHEEIAQILGVRVGTSKSQLHKARARMRELLECR